MRTKSTVNYKETGKSKAQLLNQIL